MNQTLSEYAVGYDIGSSSVKAALIDLSDGSTVGLVQHPDHEFEIIAKEKGWAEQRPEVWWDSLCSATRALLKKTEIDPDRIKSVGIAYQMHGLVVVDQKKQVLRPSIIWCDSRAVEIGENAFSGVGEEICLTHLLNAPGNFTASRLKWVKDNEPEVYAQIHKVMLPGDYIAMKLTGEIHTTISGLSECMLWDFPKHTIADSVLNYFEIDSALLPDIIGTFENQGGLTKSAAEATGLAEGTLVSYRAGDQPNNAFSLGAYQPNEVAATGGTSGVVYGVVDSLIYDKQSRINGFAHVNHTAQDPRIGLLLCINGAGSLYAWIRQNFGEAGTTFQDMERYLTSVPIGSDGLRIIPFGNGAERMLLNANPGGQINNLQFNRHTRAHVYRAAIEGIAFSFVHGFQVLRELGLHPHVIKVGNDNLFRSGVFGSTISNLLNCPIEVYATTGAIGAAKASTVALLGHDIRTAIGTNEVAHVFNPEGEVGEYRQAYQVWQKDLQGVLSKSP